MIDWVKEERVILRIREDRKVAKVRVEEERSALEAAETAVVDAKQAQDILQHLVQGLQRKVHAKIANVVSSCLAAVFDAPYEFEIRFDRKRGRTEAVLLFTRDGLEVDPLTASGGGMVDVAAFALRVACLVMHRPSLSRILVLDEPFRFVSAAYQDNVRTMLEELASEMGLQILMVTHNKNMATGKIVRV